MSRFKTAKELIEYLENKINEANKNASLPQGKPIHDNWEKWRQELKEEKTSILKEVAQTITSNQDLRNIVDRIIKPIISERKEKNFLFLQILTVITVVLTAIIG
ncbi:hypothetical protein [Candidatus Nucleicultrix amoebiphila]|jgi:hypothetical protein|uniref:Uncharacterized protein n=1 Tax=Candidatus Nucleicultrix amoebiphila FS5 TaxID=1414854 RepID=A0A1W6N3C7_9PROT|nr:hypothetical protein [Candidatus Nucleicultrix amoebiphila]ARN84289.1 hypothetical protein GQ61_01880 [Candidatus Nucleicultrix amoebiphila FS5]